VLFGLGLALLSGRAFGLRHWSERSDPSAAVRLPARHETPARSKRIIFFAAPQEDLSDLRRDPAGAVEIAVEFTGAPPRCRASCEFPAAPFSRPRAYILQSALNL